ncbi:hypothetical protein BST61_g8690 [Cercospora zeina]
MVQKTGIRRAVQYCPELAVIAFALVTTIHVIFIWAFATKYPTRQTLGEVNSLLPQFGTRLVQFPFETAAGQDDRSMEEIVNASMDSWHGVMPIGGGFVAIDDFETRTKDKSTLYLPEALHTPVFDPRVGYTISVFHQLHCLHAVQSAFNKAITGRQSVLTMDREKLLHTYHCFNYVRRALMCAADTALEGQASDSDLPETKGEGSFHLCRDFSAVSAFAVAHRLTDQASSGHD